MDKVTRDMCVAQLKNAAGGPLLKFNSLRFYDAIPSDSEIAAHWAADQEYFNIP